MSSRLITVTAELAALADACPDEAHLDEPYRRALRVIRARLTATAAEILDQQPLHLLDLGVPPYGDAGRTAGRSRHHRRLAAHARQRAAGRSTGWPSCEKACTSSGFICRGLDMRQNSDVHEEVISELLAWAGVHPDYSVAARRRAGRAAGGRTQHPSPAGRRSCATVRVGPQRAGRRRGRGPCGRNLRSGRGTQLRHLDVPIGVRRPGGRDPAQRGRPAGRIRAGTLLPGGYLTAVRDDRRPAQRRGDPASDAGTSALPGNGGRPRGLAGSDAGLLRLQQGRRISDRQLGGVPGRARAGRSRPQNRNPVAALPWSRRHRRPRRRPQLPSHPGPTAGSGERLPAPHRAG